MFVYDERFISFKTDVYDKSMYMLIVLTNRALYHKRAEMMEQFSLRKLLNGS